MKTYVFAAAAVALICVASVITIFRSRDDKVQCMAYHSDLRSELIGSEAFEVIVHAQGFETLRAKSIGWSNLCSRMPKVDYGKEYIVVMPHSMVKRVYRFDSANKVVHVIRRNHDGIGIAVMRGNPSYYFKFTSE